MNQIHFIKFKMKMKNVIFFDENLYVKFVFFSTGKKTKQKSVIENK